MSTVEIRLTILVDGETVAHTSDIMGTARESVEGMADCFAFNARELFERDERLLSKIARPELVSK